MELKILGYKCLKCGHVHYPGRTRCRKCGHDEFETVPLPGKGKLLTYTHLYTLPPDFDVPFISLGIVELENGTRMTGQLRIEKPKTGMKVKGKVEVVRKDDYNKYHGMVFYQS